MSTSRRSFTKTAAALAGGFSLQGILARENRQVQPLHVVCIGGHPDDPESGCGGTLARLKGAGHRVTIIYLTRGEAGITGTSLSAAAAIRTEEAHQACEILGAQPVFLGQIDGESLVNNEWVRRLEELLILLKPGLVFTHWPIDSHKDHQSASLLTIQAWVRMGHNLPLYFYEVCSGSQTMGFHPTDYVDITTTKEQKKRAVYCHRSQDPDSIYRSADCNHELMEQFRGVEIGATAAEAFVQLPVKDGPLLTGLM